MGATTREADEIEDSVKVRTCIWGPSQECGEPDRSYEGQGEVYVKDKNRLSLRVNTSYERKK